MKKLLFLSAIIAGSLSIQSAKAQIGVHFNINLGPRPVYVAPAPVAVPDEYYYLPDAEAYYSVPEHVYYYQNEGRWISGPRLVGRFRDYDYDHMRHYMVNEPRPYLRNDYYRERYNNTQYAEHDNHDFRNQNYRDQHDRGNYGRYEDHYDHREQDQRYHADYRGHDDHDNHNSYSRY